MNIKYYIFSVLLGWTLSIWPFWCFCIKIFQAI